jgi:hypothetical protein
MTTRSNVAYAIDTATVGLVLMAAICTSSQRGSAASESTVRWAPRARTETAPTLPAAEEGAMFNGVQSFLW